MSTPEKILCLLSPPAQVTPTKRAEKGTLQIPQKGFYLLAAVRKHPPELELEESEEAVTEALTVAEGPLWRP